MVQSYGAFVPVVAIWISLIKKFPQPLSHLTFFGHWPYPYPPKSVEISFLRVFSQMNLSYGYYIAYILISGKQLFAIIIKL